MALGGLESRLDAMLRSDGERVSAADLSHSMVAILFSAHWRRPCRPCLADLKTLYPDIKEQMEIVFVSCDRSQEEYNEHTNGMPWMRLPFGDQAGLELCRDCNVTVIPSMMICDIKTGTVLDRNGLETILNSADAIDLKCEPADTVFAPQPEYVLDISLCPSMLEHGPVLIAFLDGMPAADAAAVVQTLNDVGLKTASLSQRSRLAFFATADNGNVTEQLRQSTGMASGACCIVIIDMLDASSCYIGPEVTSGLSADVLRSFLSSYTHGALQSRQLAVQPSAEADGTCNVRTEPQQGSSWRRAGREQLTELIRSCSSTFSEWPCIRDTADLIMQLQRGLSTSLSGDFGWSLCFRPSFIAALCYEGFLPMCTEVAPSLFVLLPKLHEQRCVLFFDNLHQPKQAKKRSKHYKLTSNKAFGAVMQGCIDQHGEAWLYAPMRQIFKALLMHQHQPSQPNANPSAGPTEAEPLVAGVRIQVKNLTSAPEYNGAIGTVIQSLPQGKVVVQVHVEGHEKQLMLRHDKLELLETIEMRYVDQMRMQSFELWQDGELVAGELGVVVGTCYTSFSGFRKVNSSGTVQMIQTAHALRSAGFSFWDFGQSLPYKIDLGGQLMPRLEFLDKFHSVRDQPFPVFATDADGFLLHTDSRAQMATNGT